jgi:hypothetical protein
MNSHSVPLTKAFPALALILAGALLSLTVLTAQSRSGGLRSDSPESYLDDRDGGGALDADMLEQEPDYHIKWSAWTASDPESIENMTVTVNGEDWGHPMMAFARLAKMDFDEDTLVRMEMPLWPSVNGTFLPPRGWANEFLKRCLLEDIPVQWFCYEYPMAVNILLWTDTFNGKRYRSDMVNAELFLNGQSLGRVPLAMQNLRQLPWPHESSLLIFAPDPQRTGPRYVPLTRDMEKLLGHLFVEKNVTPVVITLTLEEHLELERELSRQ